MCSKSSPSSIVSDIKAKSLSDDKYHRGHNIFPHHRNIHINTNAYRKKRPARHYDWGKHSTSYRSLSKSCLNRKMLVVMKRKVDSWTRHTLKQVTILSEKVAIIKRYIMNRRFMIALSLLVYLGRIQIPSSIRSWCKLSLHSVHHEWRKSLLLDGALISHYFSTHHTSPGTVTRSKPYPTFIFKTHK